MSDLDILWEGGIQVCAQDKKKIWRPRTKAMQGSLMQTSSSNLKLKICADITKLADKRTLPGSEEIDLSNVTFISDMMKSKEYRLFFFCQCIILTEDDEEEILVHMFQAEHEELRRRFIEAIYEYMQRRAIKQPSINFNVTIEKEVVTPEGVKLYGNYMLRTSDTGFEFLISENIPGIKNDQGDISSVKILEDIRPEVGEHMIDLIMRGSGLNNNNYHILIKSKGGYLLLVYLQRGLDCMPDVIHSKGGISSLPIDEFIPPTPPIPPKPDNEPKPALPPRSFSPSMPRASSEGKRAGKPLYAREDSAGFISPPLPPRNEISGNSPILPPRDSNNINKAMTLPQGLKSDFNKFEIDMRKLDYRRVSEEIPPRLPERNDTRDYSRTLPRKHTAVRGPMPLPREPSALPEVKTGFSDEMSLGLPKMVESPYAEIKLGSTEINASEIQTVPEAGDEESPYQTVVGEDKGDTGGNIHVENHKHTRKPGFYKKQLYPPNLKIPKEDHVTDNIVSIETPITEVIDPDYVGVCSDEQTIDESGYLRLLSPTELGQLDSLGYATIGGGVKSVGESTSNTGSLDSSPSNSPVVPPRGYRDLVLDNLDSMGYITVQDGGKSQTSASNSKSSTPLESPVVPPRHFRNPVTNENEQLK